MPDKLKAHSNERIDLVDFILAANDYTSSTNAFDKERTWLDGKSRILEGFYVEISDQTVAPGQITVYNGTGLDRDGRLINDESLANSATTLTLAGASQSFYVEIELSESASSVDSRAFWDPTVTNTSPIPNGSEVTINVPTRITPNWQVVYPISTSGFAATTNPNSPRIPIALLNTNGSNQITSAVNTYGSLVNASTKALADTVAAAGSVTVIDSKLFAVGSSFTFDLGGANPEALTVTGNDLDNNIISFTPGLAFSHLAGAILRQTGVTARFLPQTLDPNDPMFLAVLPTGRPNDQERRMFQGDETRGSAFLASKSTYGARNDLDVRTLKDEVDFLSAVVRDMKFGHPRVDVTSNAPPSSFSTRPRYFDAVGGIAGARTAYVTVGNGTTTFGDFNGTSQTPFILAENALPANGGTIYVKPGTYTFTAAWAPTKPNVSVVGDGRLSTVLTNNNAAEAITVAGGVVSNFANLTVVTGTGSTNVVVVNASTVSFTNCEVDGITGTAAAAIIGDRTDFNRPIVATSLEDCVFTRCNFTTNSSITGTFVNCLFNSCEWTTTATAFSITGTSSNVRISDSSLVNTTTDTPVFATTGAVTNLRITNTNFVGRNTGGTVSCVSINENTADSLFDGCTFTGSHTAVTADSTIVRLANTSQNITFSNCLFSETTPGTGAIGLSRTTGTGNSIRVENCSFTGCHNNAIRAFNGSSSSGFLDIVDCTFASSNWGNYNGIYLSDFAPRTRITGCKFNSFSGLGTPTLYDIRIVSSASIATVFVENSTFSDYSTNAASRPIFISSSSINSFLSVTGSTFTTGGNVVGGTGTYRAISVAGATCSVTYNTFKSIVATGTGSIACVYNNSNPSDVKLAVRDNTFCQMSTANGTLRAVDVLYGNTDDSVSIENNTVHDITTAASSPLGLFNITHATSTDTAHKLVFSGNTVTNCQLGTGGACYALRCVYGGATISNNTFTQLTAPGSASLSSLGFSDCPSLTITDNSITDMSAANLVYGINTFSGSPLLSMHNNHIGNISSSASTVAGCFIAGYLIGTVSGSTFTSLTGTTAYGIQAGALLSASIVGNSFSLSNGANTSYDIFSSASATNTVIANNICATNGTTTVGYGVYLVNNFVDNVNVTSNTFKGYALPVRITTLPTASITSNILITNNEIDSSAVVIPTFIGISLIIDTTGTGFTRGISVIDNSIRMSSSTSSSGITVNAIGAGGHLVTGATINNNFVTESGVTITTTVPIGLDGGGVLSVATINSNTINCTGNTGARASSILVNNVSKLACSTNAIVWNTGGATSVIDINNSTYVACVGNVLSSDTTAYGLDGTSSNFDLAVGNLTELTVGPGLAPVFNFTTAANNA